MSLSNDKPAAPVAASASAASSSSSSSSAAAPSRPLVQMLDDDDDADEAEDGDEEKESRRLNDDTANLYIKNEEKTATKPTAAATAAAAAVAGSAAASSSSSAASPSAPSAVDLSAPFHLLPTVFSKDSHAALRRYYTKWDIAPTCCMHRWRFNQVVDLNEPSSLHAFLVGFVNSAAFRSSFQCYDSASRSMRALPASLVVSKVNFSAVKTTQLDLHFFDRLWGTADEPAIVYGSLEDAIPELAETAGTSGARGAAGADDSISSSDHTGGSGNGSIRKCFEDVVDGITVTDELRKMMLDRDADSYELYSAQERQELLFQLLVHVSVGGGMNQYENSVGPYLLAVKTLYKELLSVKTNRNTNKLEVASMVYKIAGMAGTDSAASAAGSGAGSSASTASGEKPVFIFGAKEKDKHHCCYLSVDPHKRQITCYYFAHTAAW